ncbi:gamma-glutamyltransferase [Chryseobacterium sp. A301]
MKKLLFLFTLVSTLAFGQATEHTIYKEIHVKNKGLVVSAHPLASEVGAKILREGGNAFDASIATQLALAVVYPQAGNLGGGGFLVGMKNTGEKFTIDFRETAPEKSTKDMYLDSSGNADTSLSQDGGLAIGIPGSVAGMFATLPYGNLPMEKLIDPAIELAEKGFAITKREADLLNAHREQFLKHNSHPIALVKKEPWKPGDLLIQKNLATTLKLIKKEGAKGFYEGATAEKVAKGVQLQKGILSLDDLKNYKVVFRTPLEFDYKGYSILTMPLPSSGGILLAQMLRMSSFAHLDQMGFQSPEAMQVMIEAQRRAYADRAEFMGDPAFVKDPTERLISKSYLKERWKSFNPLLATPSAEVGEIIKQPAESTETTHISILDRDHNAVSVTTTLNGLYGSKVIAPGTGFLLNNEMDDFSIKPGVPNMFGAVGGAANAIEPGKRMLSSMTPTIVLKDNKPFLVVGTPGGTTIPTSVYQTIVGLIDFKLSPNRAVNAPKFHHQWLPESVQVEKGFNTAPLKVLESKNYVFKTVNQIGRTEIIAVQEDGSAVGVADSRGDDSVSRE